MRFSGSTVATAQGILHQSQGTQHGRYELLLSKEDSCDKRK
uniref:Uncharacterized protein n=1 Tax=Anguilla anguilla TaxID=7936 RepID=A0A0E9VRI7_ANGAN